MHFFTRTSTVLSRVTILLSALFPLNISDFYKRKLFFRPDLIAYEELIPSEHIDNLNNAFNVADERLGIHKILDAEGL